MGRNTFKSYYLVRDWYSKYTKKSHSSRAKTNEKKKKASKQKKLQSDLKMARGTEQTFFSEKTYNLPTVTWKGAWHHQSSGK